MAEHAGGSAWLDAVLYDGALTKADPLLDRAGRPSPYAPRTRASNHGVVAEKLTHR